MADPSNADLSEMLKRVHNALGFARFQPGFKPEYNDQVNRWAAGYSLALGRSDPAKTRAWYEEGLRLTNELRYLGVERGKLWIAAGVGAAVVLGGIWMFGRGK